MDRLEKAVARAERISFAFAETTVAAKALEARHLCGPAAAAALGEAITAVALLAASTARADETVMLRMNVSGELGGAMAEAAGDGGLRGFTNRKIIPRLDERIPVDTTEAWGRSGSAQIVTSRPGEILNQSVLNVNPPLMRFVLARYFNHSMQIPTACAVCAEAGGGGLISARGLLAQRMPDSDADAFLRVLEGFEDGSVAACLAEPPPHGGAAKFAALLDLHGIEVHETRALLFKCRCSRERSLATLDALSRKDLRELIANGGGQDISCHMCGHTYSADTADLKAALERKA